MGKSLSNLPDLIIFNISTLGTYINQAGNRICHEKEFNLEMDQLPLLMLLYYTEFDSQQSIADALMRNKASVARTVSYLLKCGYVHISPGPDKRKNSIRLSDKGMKIAAEVEKSIFNLEDKLLSEFNGAEVKRIKQLLMKLISVFQK